MMPDHTLSSLDLVGLSTLMEKTRGQPAISVAVIDGPVASDHPDLAGQLIRRIDRGSATSCSSASSAACLHGTFVIGILAAKTDSVAPAICPGCTFLVRPIFTESVNGAGHMASSTLEELAEAIADCVNEGARVINLSSGLPQPAPGDESKLQEALNYAARYGVIVVAAAGNQSTIGSSAITHHSWVIPVVACDDRGSPSGQSNLGRSIGRRGLRAPGENITSLGATGAPQTVTGTSAAAPFVTGAIALLWSEFPRSSAADVWLAITQADIRRGVTVVPPLLNAWTAYQVLAPTS